MSLRTLLLLAVICLVNQLNAQTVIWTEDFQNGCMAACPGGAYVGTNGPWTQFVTGAEGADPNTFFVSCAENNTGVGNCSGPCGSNQTMHISAALGNIICPNDCGAAYDAGGLCGILSCPLTDKRIESPTINLTGQNTISVNFEYLEGGDGTNDNATLWYFDGTIWSLLDDMPKTPVPAACSGQGEWTARTVALPASANNNANVKIAFRWVNNDDGVGSDPSFAVDEITLTVPTVAGPTASFSSNDSTLCIGDCINFTDLSTGAPNGWTWYFPGAATTTSTAQNPTNICYNTAGTFDVSLFVTDGTNTDSLYMPNFITVSALPVVTANAAPSTTVCIGDMVTLTGGGATSYTWSGGVTNGVPFSIPATTTYIVTGTNAAGCSDTTSITITANNCSQPTASFSPDSLTICAGGDILFTDLSTGTNITTWAWDFDFTTLGGVVPATANTQGPHNVTYNNPGVYTVRLSVTDANGTDDTTMVVTVTNCNVVNAAFNTSNTTICAGDSVVFTDASTGGVTSWLWDFDLTTLGGVAPATANTQGPHTVFYNNPGVYTAQLIVSDGVTSDTITTAITVNSCTPPTGTIGMDDADGEICVDNCIDFSYIAGTGGVPTTVNWTFPGGTPSSSTALNPGVVCWNDTTGVFNVTMTATNSSGSSSDNITVTVHEKPMVNAGLDTTITIGEDGYLNAVVTDTAGNPISTTGGSYSWSPSSILGCPNCQNTSVIQPIKTGTYTVTYTDQYGCVVTDEVVINIDIQLNIGVPSAFSPGSDFNNILFVKGEVVVKAMNFTIYNRYGQKVFETTNIEQGWDGTHNGKELNPGVFVYYLDVTFIDGSKKQLKGNVTLVR